MFRFIALLCLLHFSVGTIIRGRVLLNGDANRVDYVPAGSLLVVSLIDTSMADAPAITLKEAEISNFVNFPINYQIQVPADISPVFSYTLTAYIKNGDTTLYLNEEYTPVTINTNSFITVDIPVTTVGTTPQLLLTKAERLSWPELVGRKGTYAVQYIKEKTGFTNVVTVPEGSMVTMDYRTNRVRVFVNENGVVTQTPRIG